MYTDWQKERYNQNQSCFIQAVFFSYYAEQQKNYSQYHILKESQTLCRGTIKLA